MSIKRTNEEYKMFLENNKRNIINLDPYVNNKTKIKHLCEKCGTIWEQKPEHILHGHGCPNCAKQQRSKSLTLTNDEYVSRVNLMNPDINIIGNYNGMHKKIMIECTKCSDQHEVYAYELLQSHKYNACKKCYTNARKKNDKNIEQELKDNNPGVLIVEEYRNNYTKTKFKCTQCDKLCEWYATPSSVLKGSKPKFCHISLGERKIAEYLNKNKISYEYQYIFDDCYDKSHLPFDFYIPEYNLCIEYDGEQHFKPVQFNGCSFQKAYNTHCETKEHDKIKNMYCQKSNIKLLRIPYYKINEIDTILFDYFTLGGII